MVWSETRKMLNINYQAQRTALLNEKAPAPKRQKLCAPKPVLPIPTLPPMKPQEKGVMD